MQLVQSRPASPLSRDEHAGRFFQGAEMQLTQYRLTGRDGSKRTTKLGPPYLTLSLRGDKR
jgi:hypothetical protein